MERDSKQRHKVTQVMQRLADATGFHANALSTILKREDDDFPDASEPEKRNTGRQHVHRIHRVLIRAMFIELLKANKHISVRSLYEKLEGHYSKWKQKPPFGESTLYRVITEDLGWRIGKRQRKRKDARAQKANLMYRDKYINDIRMYRQQGYAIVYVDETWFSKHMHIEDIWVADDEAMKYCRSVPDGKGSRAIVVHAGGYLGKDEDGNDQYGFVEGADWIFEGKKKHKDKQDYHKEMNGDAFKDWWTNKLLPSKVSQHRC